MPDKYKKMLSIGLAHDQVLHKMVQDGFDPATVGWWMRDRRLQQTSILLHWCDESLCYSAGFVGYGMKVKFRFN
jgi:hypothetical protein